MITGFMLNHLFGPFSVESQYNPVGSYQDINPFPIVSTSPHLSAESRAIVTSLYSDDFAFAVATLGHSLASHNITERRLVMYLPDRLSSRSLCIVAAAGWEPFPVAYIEPPHHGDGVHRRFADQFTKLNIWGFDKIGVDVLLYLDADTIVRDRFDELWGLPYSFAAVQDVHDPPRGFVVSFNAGVMLLRTSSAVLADMLQNLETASFPRKQAEQAFLNTYFAPQTLRLPYIYNGNLAIKQHAPSVWASMKNELRIVHYTVRKPFWDFTEGSDWRQRMQESIDKAMEEGDGNYSEEVQWWSDVWDDLIGQRFSTLNACS